MLNRITTKLTVAPLVLGLVYGAPAFAEAPPYEPVPFELELHQVGEHPVYYVLGKSGVPGAENAGHTSNGGFVITSEGVVVYDALGTPSLGYALLEKIRELTDQPVKRVVVGHYHADHIYGLQAFKDHTDAKIVAQESVLRYFDPDTMGHSEDLERRLAQRRQALFPWVDDATYVVPPDETFGQTASFEMGGLQFELRHMGPAHAPGDSIMLVKDFGVVFSGDLIFSGRVPFLDSPQVDTGTWLDGLEYLAGLEPSFIIPGHGPGFDQPDQAISFTREYIAFVRERMSAAVEEFTSFDEAYAQVDWSRYEDLPAFEASNRGNAYRVYLEMEEQSF